MRRSRIRSRAPERITQAHERLVEETAERAPLMTHRQTDAIFTAKSHLVAIRERLGAAIAAAFSRIADAERLQTEPGLFALLISDAYEAISRPSLP